MLFEIIFVVISSVLIFICLYTDFHRNCIKLYRKKNYINKEKCYQIIKDVDECMRKHNIFYYMSEGTALGLYRDGDLVEWDDDVDFGIFEKDYEKFKNLFVPDIDKKGYMYNNFGLIGRQHLVDFEFVAKDKKCISKWDRPCNELIPHLKKFRKIKWRGLELNVPEESYYVYLYGKDWRIPKKEKPKRE